MSKCPYCRVIEPRIKHEVDDMRITITKGYNGEPLCDVVQMAEDGIHFTCSMTFEIRFCPFCGRDLRGTYEYAA